MNIQEKHFAKTANITKSNDSRVFHLISEETGAISLAYNANIYYNLDLDKTKNMLIMLLSGKEVVPHDLQKNDNGKEEDDAE